MPRRCCTIKGVAGARRKHPRQATPTPHISEILPGKSDREQENVGPSYQQKGWKSVNFAHPFSSGVGFSGAAESQTLDPTSMATQGVGGFEFTGSNTAVHPDPADTDHGAAIPDRPQNLWPSQKRSRVVPETEGEGPSHGTTSKRPGAAASQAVDSRPANPAPRHWHVLPQGEASAREKATPSELPPRARDCQPSSE